MSKRNKICQECRATKDREKDEENVHPRADSICPGAGKVDEAFRPGAGKVDDSICPGAGKVEGCSDDEFQLLPETPSEAKAGVSDDEFQLLPEAESFREALGEAEDPQPPQDLSEQPVSEAPLSSDHEENCKEASQTELDQASLRKPSWSVGAELHAIGQCRPCAWHWKPSGCANGVECEFCHTCEAGSLQKRRKQRIALYRAARERIHAEKLSRKSPPPQAIFFPPHLLPPHLLPKPYQSLCHGKTYQFRPPGHVARMSQCQALHFGTEGEDSHQELQEDDLWLQEDDCLDSQILSGPSAEDLPQAFSLGGQTNVLARFSF